MGFWNLFRRADTSKLKEWQDLLVKNQTRLIYSKKQLVELSNIYINRKLEIATDSINILNTTCNTETFFSRYELTLSILSELSDFEKFVPFTNSPEQELNKITSEKDRHTKDFIERAWESLLTKNRNLKTEKGKNNRILKFFNELDKYTTELGPTSLAYLNNLKEKNANSTQLHTNEVTTIVKSSDKSLINDTEWNISISFGKSTSSNYERAIFLAKESPKYYTNGSGKDIVHQATYSSSIDDYLSFIKLYQLIGSWKSCFVFVNGELTDKKIIGKLNYCYGDKCRSGNKNFCYGASEFTENPFGCHRLQISKFNHPWWGFGSLDSSGIWHINKKDILDRINQNFTPFKNCPSFSYENIIYALNQLPSTIDCNNNKNWSIIDGSIYPKSDTIKLFL